ncbi:MAG TPA: DUF899 domain-containing protein [Fimbriimonadaceae bacterium]|jgi:predicted dithiol-disulfide oxidoreductase (DUF899 family)
MNNAIEELAHPPVVSESEWLAQRLKLLAEEKALTKAYDRVNALRRRLPMVKVEKPYTFTGPDGEKTLLDLFEGKRQLIVHHFMFDPAWDKGCGSCTWHTNQFGNLSTLGKTDTSMVTISRAPIEKLLTYQSEKGWTNKWYSSYGTDFNYDFMVTVDPARGQTQYNYKTVEDLSGVVGNDAETSELPGMSVFFRVGDDVFHTYSAYGRGLERLMDTFGLLDITPYGRQEDFEDSPEGWPQSPTYG